MSLITWVGINHYVDEKCLKDFYASLHEGDVVRMVPEADNYWDKNAVAVYHNYLMRGHVCRHETSCVHEMAKCGMELVGRVTDDVDEEFNQVKISVDTVVREKEELGYAQIPASVIGMKINPHIMYEEYSYRQIRESVDMWVRVIRTNDLCSDAVGSAVRMIREAMETYLTIWDRSISREANELPRYFENVLMGLMKLNDEIKAELKGIVVRLRRCTAKQPHADVNMKTFVGQMEALDRMYSKEEGFYAKYEKRYGGKTEVLRKRLDSIREWLNELTEGNEFSFESDFRSFVHRLYCDEYKAKDLYMIITHLLVMRRIGMMLYGVPADVRMDKLAGCDVNVWCGNVRIGEYRE